jgi:plastocyanin
MPPLPQKRLFAALFVAVAVTVSGCGSGRSADVAADQPVRVAMSEFRLDPQQLRLAPGRRTVEVVNDGTMVHRFELRSADGSKRVAIGRPLRPGERETLTVRLRAGRYLMRCAQERHNTLGEWGRVTVG